MARSAPLSRSPLWPRRVAASVVAIATALAGVSVIDLADASATVAPASVVAVTGFLTTPSSDPDLVTVNYTVTVQGEQLSGAALATRTFASVPVDTSTVRVDGSPVAAGAITRSPISMKVQLGTLGSGAYLVSYNQRRPTREGRDASTGATLTSDHATVVSKPLALTHPDLSLSMPKGSGEDHAAYLGTGRLAAYGAVLKNAGAAADDVILTVRFSTGVRLDYVDGVARLELGNGGTGTPDDITCADQARAVVTCHLGAVAHGSRSVLLIPVVATRAGKAGTRGTFRIGVAPAGEPDQSGADNALTGRVRFTGIARLHCRLIAAHRTVTVGSTVTVRLRIHNAGPQPAGFTYGLVASGKHFVIKKFITTRRPRHQRPVQRITAPAQYGTVIQWNAGLIGAHHTASARMILTAKSVGSSRVEFYGTSAAADPSCDGGPGRCHALTTLKLRAVKRATADVKQN